MAAALLALAACNGAMMEARPVCMETYGKGGQQIVPMYKCEQGQSGTMINP
ncbi:MAG TPA: hypothetical protein VLA52_11610 [Thermohalobaculum sp.]|nr:hypothetical protein [Thermohalobaculum sp.]